MSSAETNPYADHDRMANHWWWRPGWHVGTRFYAWHITLDGQDDLHELIDQYQEALKPFPALDPIPRQWRHITLQGLGHVEEVSDQMRDEAVQAVAERLAKLDPIKSTFGRAVIFREAIALPPSNPDAYIKLRGEIRAAIADAWGCCPEAEEGFRAHISVAYSSGETFARPVRTALDNVHASAADLGVQRVSLIRMHRDQRIYQWNNMKNINMGRETRSLG